MVSLERSWLLYECSLPVSLLRTSCIDLQYRISNIKTDILKLTQLKLDPWELACNVESVSKYARVIFIAMILSTRMEACTPKQEKNETFTVFLFVTSLRDVVNARAGAGTRAAARLRISRNL